MALRRGFKSYANRLALDVRQRLGLRAVARLRPERLAELLGVELIALTSLRDASPRVVDYFEGDGRNVFSAMTLVIGDGRAVVFNDAHSRRRQASDIAHELAHVMLGHAPQRAVDAYGCRVWNGDCEEEADWLAGALLVPDEAALRNARIGLTIDEAAWCYRVSCDLMRWRMRVTAAHRRVGRGPSYLSRAAGRVGLD